MKIAIAFASLSGNTLSIANHLQDFLLNLGHDVTMYDMMDTSAEQLKTHNLVLMGISTYDDGLNPIGELFFSSADADNHFCNHTKFAIFSLGDSSYPNFAIAGETVMEKLKTMGALVLEPILTLDGPPTEEMFAESEEWVEQIIHHLGTASFSL